jgi:MoxR-like ATPase
MKSEDAIHAGASTGNRPDTGSLDAQMAQFVQDFRQLCLAVERVIIGHPQVVRMTLLSMLAGGHVLLEGVPGLGKTRLVKTLARLLDLHMSRISFTPDLMPADIIGTHMLLTDESGNRRLQFQPGPIFGNLILADEINRAAPKTQSALLEAMNEQTVTVGREQHRLPRPFFVLATQNPIEMEGTFPLPEAQLDRFMMKLSVGKLGIEELRQVIAGVPDETDIAPLFDPAWLAEMQTLAGHVLVSPEVLDCAAALLDATHPESSHASDRTKKYVRLGCSPRSGRHLLSCAKVAALAAGRPYVAPVDIDGVAGAVLAHRLLLNYEAAAEDIRPAELVEEILQNRRRH